jgi:hypothetical protein
MTPPWLGASLEASLGLSFPSVEDSWQDGYSRLPEATADGQVYDEACRMDEAWMAVLALQSHGHCTKGHETW